MSLAAAGSENLVPHPPRRRAFPAGTGADAAAEENGAANGRHRRHGGGKAALPLLNLSKVHQTWESEHRNGTVEVTPPAPTQQQTSFRNRKYTRGRLPGKLDGENSNVQVTVQPMLREVGSLGDVQTSDGANQAVQSVRLPTRKPLSVRQPTTARDATDGKPTYVADETPRQPEPAGGAVAEDGLLAAPRSVVDAGAARTSVANGAASNGASQAATGGPAGAAATPAAKAMTPAQALKAHMKNMTPFEQAEVLEYPEVYFLGSTGQKVRAIPGAQNNNGYDDERGDYHLVFHDHIGYRYEVIELLGKGSFGQVVKAYDYKTNTMNALKIIRNKKRFHHQALVEVKILCEVRDMDADNNSSIIHLRDHFYFRNHLCITFELLSVNLYEFIKLNNFQGFSPGLIRRFAIQILHSLRFLKQHRIIHCDLKPENVLLKHPTKSGIKVIDLGSSCYEHERVYTYIQSRFYRSPEVILGIPYGTPIDMWSLGCILAELFTGYPLFPGENETEQLLCIQEICGLPPRRMLENAKRRKVFFDSQGCPRIVPNTRGKKRIPNSKDLASALRCDDPVFVSFLGACMRWDPQERMTPEEGLQHPWITQIATPQVGTGHLTERRRQRQPRLTTLSGAATSRPAGDGQVVGTLNSDGQRLPQIATETKSAEEEPSTSRRSGDGVPRLAGIGEASQMRAT